MTVAGLFYLGYVLYETLVLGTTVRGWSSLVSLQILFSGATLTAVGLMGDYVARIYEEIKGRPLYVVAETTNLPPGTATPVRAMQLIDRPPYKDARERAEENGAPRACQPNH